MTTVPEGCVPDTPATATTFPALGYPVQLFIDTSVYEGLNFAFTGSKLKAVQSAVEAGDVRLVLPEITRHEVMARINKAVADAATAAKRFRGEAMVLRNLPDHPVAALFGDTAWYDIQKSLLGQWEAFASTCRAFPLAVDTASSIKVFEDYFNGVAPFARAGKKSEFPDAFVVNSLRKYGTVNQCKVAVVSTDNDFRDSCKDCSVLVRCDDLAQLLAHSRWLATFHPERIRELLRPLEEQLEKDVISAFSSLHFICETGEFFDTDAVAVQYGTIDNLDVWVIDVEGDWATFAGEVGIDYFAQVTPDDPDFRDFPNESIYPPRIGGITLRIAAKATVPISFRVNVPLLSKGTVETEDIVINDESDIHIENAQILSALPRQN